MEAKSLFFGYGPAASLTIMRALTGNPNLTGREAVLKGYKLGLQRLDQVPNTRTIAPKSPQEILRESWSDGSCFLVAIPDKEGKVAGMVWELTPDEAALFEDFELIDLNWYKKGEGKAITSDGQELAVSLPVLGDGQEISGEVDGFSHDPWSGSSQEMFVKVAEKSRREFLERTGMTPEGQTTSETVSRS